MCRAFVRLALAFAFAIVPATGALAASESGNEPQSAEPSDRAFEALRIFLDCPACDFDYLRTEITYVNYVVDRGDAQVHVLVTTQLTGSGGTEFTLEFIGQRGLADIQQRLLYASSGTDTADEVRQSFAQTFQLGLMPFVAGTPLADHIDIVHDSHGRAPVAAQPADDPWRFWVFRTRVNARYSGEESRMSKGAFGSFSANRTTEQWKINIGLNGAYSDDEFDLGDSTFRNVTQNIDLSGLVVGSLGEHWAWAAGGSATSSTFVNQDLTIRLAPGIQYNIFPFAESTRRQLTFSYTVGANRFDYEEVTIFNQTIETLLDHTVTVALDLNQPWGQTSFALEAAQFLDDPSHHRVVFAGSIDFRVVRGLSLNLSGNVSRIRDQVSRAEQNQTTVAEGN